jgi:aldehyde dehydrogenase (NAD+)
MNKILRALGMDTLNSGTCGGPGKWAPTKDRTVIASINPTTGETLATVAAATPADYGRVMTAASAAFEQWRMVPAPRRGEIVRQIGDALRANKEALGSLVSLEMGKIRQEGLGEVQEMIDMADLAVGQARMLYGSTMHSERPLHRMYEQWHPLGVVGVVTAFNFPVAVWAWNAFLAAICGNVVVWKPSSKVPLCAIAVQHLCNAVLKANGLPAIFTLFVGNDARLKEKFLNDPRVALVSFTGSSRVGHLVAGTTRCSSTRAPISISPCRPSCSARSVPPASAAPARGASSRTGPCTTSCWSGCAPPTRKYASAIRSMRQR